MKTSYWNEIKTRYCQCRHQGQKNDRGHGTAFDAIGLPLYDMEERKPNKRSTTQKSEGWNHLGSGEHGSISVSGTLGTLLTFTVYQGMFS